MPSDADGLKFSSKGLPIAATHFLVVLFVFLSTKTLAHGSASVCGLSNDIGQGEKRVRSQKSLAFQA